MIKNNYHTHVAYCHHAQGDVEDYVLKALELGFKEIGMTDHAPVLESFMPQKDYIENFCDQNMNMDTVPIYLKDIKEAQIKYGDKIKIYSGFESEFLPNQLSFYQALREKVDYLNLGIHYYIFENKIINPYKGVNFKTLEGYVATAIKAMESGLFNTLVHPDLFMLRYKDKNGKRVFDECCVAATKRICEAAIKYNIYLEVNAGGIKRITNYDDYSLWPYPCEDFWRIAKEYKDLKIIIGADAHTPQGLYNEKVEAICKFVKDLNIPILDTMEINH